MGPKSRNTQADSDRELGLRIQSEDKIERGLQILDGIKSGKPDSRARTEITSWKTESENSPEARRGTSGGEKLEQEKQIPSSAPRTKTERRAHTRILTWHLGSRGLRRNERKSRGTRSGGAQARAARRITTKGPDSKRQQEVETGRHRRRKTNLRSV
jgi:hypothetical protein